MKWIDPILWKLKLVRRSRYMEKRLQALYANAYRDALIEAQEELKQLEADRQIKAENDFQLRSAASRKGWQTKKAKVAA